MPSTTPEGTAASPLRVSPTVWWTTLAMALAALDLSQHLFVHWVSFDEGAMAQAATLVRGGAWPHRDFTDIYSGGLAILDAGAQWLFGDNLRALRIPFGLAAVAWVGLLAAWFRRFVSPPAAAGLALVAFLWGPPLYTAAMPSWYLLFLATGVVWSLFRWHETQDARWWGMAGLLVGLAIFIKINALFLLAASGCVLLLDDRVRSGWLGTTLVFLGVAGACLTVSRGWPAAGAAMLYLPLLALAIAALRHDRARVEGLAPDFRRTLRPGLWLALGVGAVLVPWLGAYAVSGALRPLIDGMLVLPLKRTAFAAQVPPPYWLPDLLVAALFGWALFGRWTEQRTLRAAVLIVTVALFIAELARRSPMETLVYFGWREIRILGLAALLAVAVVQWKERGTEGRAMMIAGWVAAWFALLQYPFAAPNYFAYVAPLLLLAGTAAAVRTIPRSLGAAIALALAIWTTGVDHDQPLTILGYGHFSPPRPLAVLDLPRGGLRVPEHEAIRYLSIDDVLDRWNARTIVAGPDAPEIYYLTGRPFQGREFFEFMAPNWSTAEFVERIRSRRPDAVVLNLRPYFSRISIDAVVAALPTRPIADTTIGQFRLLRFAAAPASAPAP
ncbi:MAG TPA: glycosyltransferase family 39 protein [Gemmatimonadales bacterium]|nr:glycosyltransferase family 39 protein [Gemmatimonadales bacterium]